MSGSHPEQIANDTLAAIYGAAVSPLAWEDAIDRCTHHVGACSGAIFSLDALVKDEYEINVTSHLIRSQSTAQEFDHWLKNLAHYEAHAHGSMLQIPARTILVDTDHWPDESLLLSRPDYDYLYRKFGFVRKLVSRLNENPRYFEILAFHFPAVYKTVPESARSLMHQLLPHVAKAVEMSVMYERLQKNHAAVLAALDHVGLGLMVVDARGRVIVRNHEANRILEADRGLELSSQERLLCRTSEDTELLSMALQHAALKLETGVTVAERVITIRTMASAELLIVDVSPLRDHLQEVDAGDDAVLVQLVDTECHHYCSPEIFSQAYRLTDAEAGVVKLLLEGLSNGEIAEIRGTGMQTVKTQVSSIMQKSGVSTRVQLVRRVLQTDIPVARPDELGSSAKR